MTRSPSDLGEGTSHPRFLRTNQQPYVCFWGPYGLGIDPRYAGYGFLVILGVLVVLQTRQARRDAKVLQEKFGRSYLEYRKQTWF